MVPTVEDCIAKRKFQLEYWTWPYICVFVSLYFFKFKGIRIVNLKCLHREWKFNLMINWKAPLQTVWMIMTSGCWSSILEEDWNVGIARNNHCFSRHSFKSSSNYQSLITSALNIKSSIDTHFYSFFFQEDFSISKTGGHPRYFLIKVASGRKIQAERKSIKSINQSKTFVVLP